MLPIPVLLSALLAATIAAPTPAPSVAPSPAPSPATASAATTIPAGTKINVHLVKMLSSHDSQTGEKFGIVVAEDVSVGGVVVVPHCAAGAGVVTLAGKHGINGHEGNLHLRFDSVQATDGSDIALKADEQQFAGKERKLTAFMVTRWINGDDIEIHTDKILTVTTAVDTQVKIGSTNAAPACPAEAASSATTPAP